jgi:hypothetical protein
VFNREFFSGPSWLERIREFGAEHDGPIRVDIVTANGSRYDTGRFTLSDVGMTLFPRVGEDTIVFLPYDQIAQIEIAVMRDRREPGFSSD